MTSGSPTSTATAAPTNLGRRVGERPAFHDREAETLGRRFAKFPQVVHSATQKRERGRELTPSPSSSIVCDSMRRDQPDSFSFAIAAAGSFSNAATLANFPRWTM